MIMKEKKEQIPVSEQQPAKENAPADDLWENCKGQCGNTPWCRDCMREKEKLLEEKLNRERRSDDK